MSKEIAGQGELPTGKEAVNFVESFLKQQRGKDQTIKPTITSAKLSPTPETFQPLKSEEQILAPIESGLEKMEDLRLKVVSKYLADLGNKKPIPLTSRRTMKINSGELTIDLAISETGQNIALYWEKKIKDGFDQIIRSEEKSVYINQGGYFQIRTENITPPYLGLVEIHFINKHGSAEINPKTPEAIKEAENLVKLYLQTGKSKLNKVKSFIQQLLPKHP